MLSTCVGTVGMGEGEKVNGCDGMQTGESSSGMACVIGRGSVSGLAGRGICAASCVGKLGFAGTCACEGLEPGLPACER